MSEVMDAPEDEPDDDDDDPDEDDEDDDGDDEPDDPDVATVTDAVRDFHADLATLDTTVVRICEVITDLRTQRDELLAALKNYQNGNITLEAQNAAIAAIAHAEAR